MGTTFRQIIEAPSQLLQDPFNLLTWLSSFWRKLGQVEEWHEVGTSGEPAFENSWVNFGGSEAIAAFYKDPWERVHIKGLIKSGTLGVAVFTLPSTHRTSEHLQFATVVSGNTSARILISSTGAVTAIAGNNTWFSINCSFRVEV